MPDALAVERLHFVFTVILHYIFSPFTMGQAVVDFSFGDDCAANRGRAIDSSSQIRVCARIVGMSFAEQGPAEA